ncbi:PAS domain S-box protein [Malaciobacter marinus]|uniref:PAS domain S-box protein n=1 Tax=Malaciobacter marinus TaxID=505249 RepID=UPI0009A7BAEC|nr:PAS domain S-box protein [Malaciobacter marinus]SKB74396.1 PAS domain S-box-containing protein [Malaciobacter marinus]
MQDATQILSYLSKISVLYVEDDKFTQDEVRYFLETKVKNFYCANNGQEGLDIFYKESIDVIITDIQMPILTGLDMAKKIKEENSNIPIIITTAYNDTKYLFESINLGVSNYITKPLNLKDMIETLVSIAKSILLEKEKEQIQNILTQYKDIVDERSIISKTDINGKIIYVNRPFLEISGYKKEELIGKPHSIIRHPDIKKDFFLSMWHLIKNEKKSWQGEVKNQAKDGSVYYLDMIIKPILDMDGNIVEFISLSNDITYLMQTKEYFKKQTEKKSLDLDSSLNIIEQYENAIDMSNIIIRLDLNRKITYVNDAFVDCLGYAKDEILGSDYSILKQTDLKKDEYEKKVKAIFSKDGWKGKITNTSKDGDLLHFDVHTFPLKDTKGNIFEYLGIRHDITEIVNLHKEVEKTQREIIYTLGDVGEYRSQETGQHVKRVAEYSKLLAKKTGLSEIEIDEIFTASPMHDIGKVGIPDSILNKPGKLDDKEWEIMKTHAQIGYEILKNSQRPMLKAAAIVSYTHHEKWDGSGYPNALRGEDIHIYGRITAIADVFDALGSDRTYKKAWPLENILNLFNEQKGKHFDPNLIDLFMDNLDEFLEIKDRLKD